MNTLPEDIQDTIYKYKHHLEFRNVMDEMKCSVRWVWTTCDCERGCESDWSDDSAYDYASHSEYYDDTDSDSYYPVRTLEL